MTISAVNIPGEANGPPLLLPEGTHDDDDMICVFVTSMRHSTRYDFSVIVEC